MPDIVGSVNPAPPYQGRDPPPPVVVTTVMASTFHPL